MPAVRIATHGGTRLGLRHGQIESVYGYVYGYVHDYLKCMTGGKVQMVARVIC